MPTCEDPCQVRQVMATKHTLWIHANMIKSEHSHQKYTVDLCVKDSNLNIATRHTMWIYATVH
jgi:hypothetical protein